MAYRELIKNFNKIRDYMRDFYVYGFRTREDFDRKSGRSYDNERRRAESWLGDAMSFHRNSCGKSVFVSVDNRTLAGNPLYRAWKAKSFTDKDITLHFLILDVLAGGEALSTNEIVDRIAADYVLEEFQQELPDAATVRNKLKEYASLGILQTTQRGKEILYARRKDDIDLLSWEYGIQYASETMPLGVVGSFLLDKMAGTARKTTILSYKHHYLMGVLDSEIVEQILEASDQGRRLELQVRTKFSEQVHQHKVFPLNIYISTRTGREYLLGYQYRSKRPKMYRLDYIKKIEILECEPEPQQLEKAGNRFKRYLWGTSSGSERKRDLDHLELTVHVGDGEGFIVDRLRREARNGMVEQVGNHSWRYSVDAYDSGEMLPWLRTFIGRIEKLECSNAATAMRFRQDLEEMQRMYGGGHGVS